MVYNKGKKKKIFKIINIILVIYAFTLSVGYAFYKDSLNIKGTVTAADVYEGDNLPVDLVMADEANQRHFIEENHKHFVDFRRESIDASEYRAYFNKNVGMATSRHTTTYKFRIINPTTLPFENGTVTTEIRQNPYDGIQSLDATISTTTLNPGETCELACIVNHYFSSYFTENEVGCYITFDLQKKPRTYRFILAYNGAGVDK